MTKCGTERLVVFHITTGPLNFLRAMFDEPSVFHRVWTCVDTRQQYVAVIVCGIDQAVPDSLKEKGEK